MQRTDITARKTVSASKIPDEEMSYTLMKHKYNRVASEAQQ